MRHGAAVDIAPSGRDFDRSLTDEGRAHVTQVAKELRLSRNTDVPRVLASPLLRAQQTADLLVRYAAAVGSAIETREELATDEPMPLTLVAALTTAGADALLVGHQPTLSA